MKTYLLSVIVLFTALRAFAEASQSEVALRGVPCGYVVRKLEVSPNVQIERGATQMSVRRLLGAPVRALSPDVWVYTGYHPELVDAGQADGCDTMIVTFASGKVVDMKIVNLRAAQVIAQNMNRAVTRPEVAGQ